jgi:hypothetical protein
LRLLIPALLLGSLAACGTGGATGPDATLISVRVRDDRGLSAGRNEVVVLAPAAGSQDARTGADGNADIVLDAPGPYRVTVIPRDGYVAGSDPLTKTITVEAHTRIQVRFTLFRSSWTPDPTLSQ